MTEISQTMLDNSIAALKDSFPHMEDPTWVCGMCFIVSSRFFDFLESNGIKSDILLLLDYSGKPFDNIHRFWDGRDLFNHTVILVGDKVYDFTRRQFDPSAPVPFIQTLAETRSEWEYVEKGLPWEDTIERYIAEKREAQSRSSLDG